MPYPFPHAQLVNLFLLVFTVTSPFAMACAFTPSPTNSEDAAGGGAVSHWNMIMAAIASWVVTSGFYLLSEVARDLEVCVCVCVCVCRCVCVFVCLCVCVHLLFEVARDLEICMQTEPQE